MNNMKKQDIKVLKGFAGLVGDFIRYWGFRRIHGEIWAVTFLTKEPLSGTDLMKILGVSKALISPALKELEDEGLIVAAQSENSKVKRYQAVEDVSEVIKGVLDRREKVLVERIGSEFSKVKGLPLDQERIQKVEEMVQFAQTGLSLFLGQEKFFEGIDL